MFQTYSLLGKARHRMEGPYISNSDVSGCCSLLHFLPLSGRQLDRDKDTALTTEAQTINKQTNFFDISGRRNTSVQYVHFAK